MEVGGALEVELKARVADMAATEARIASFATYERSFDKADLYFRAPSPLPSVPGMSGVAAEEERGRAFRLRRDGDKAYVTFKAKTREAGVEVNREREFEVSEPAAFEELCARLGCVVAVRKGKRGRAYRHGDILLELCEVAGLGNFLEIETMLPADSGAADIARAKEGLHAALARAGLAEGDVEERYYTEMLAAKGLA